MHPILKGDMVAKWLVLLPCSTVVLGSNPTKNNICMELLCSPCVCMSFLKVL